MQSHNPFVYYLLIILFISLPCIAAVDDDTDGKVPLKVPQLNGAVSVDGLLDENIWEDALSLELQYEYLPGDNVTPPVKTTVLVAYNESHLLVAFRAYDDNPEAIRSQLADRDTTFRDDYVGVSLDTFNDERRSFNLSCNPLGVQMDSIMSGASAQGNRSWDAIWNSAGRIHEWGYVVEMAIPFSSLRFQRSDGDQIWGLDAIRNYPRSMRHLISLNPRDRNNNCYQCQMLKISGFDGVNPGRNIELLPSMSAIRTDSRPDFPNGEMERENDNAEAGITAKWGVTPNLTFNGTINPDFSQVEADIVRLDINENFAIFYPERRPFFLEGQDFINTAIQAVSTRSIADPSWGMKLTGKEGSHAIGAYVVEDEITNLIFPGPLGSSQTSLPMNNKSSVFRYRHDFSQSSTVGFLATDRQGGNYYNRVFGADGVYRFTPRDMFSFQALSSSTQYGVDTALEFDQPENSFQGSAIRARYEHMTRDWNAYAMFQQFDTDFRADLGFIPQTGHRWSVLGGEKTWRGTKDDFLSESATGFEYDESANLANDGELIFKEFESWVRLHGPMQSMLWIRAGRNRENYQDFTSVNTFAMVAINFQPTGNLHLGLGGWSPGDAIDYLHKRKAFRNRVAPWARIKFGKHLSMYLQHEINSLSVEGDRLFLANMSSARIYYQFDRRTFVRGILQYTDIRRNQLLYEDDIDEVSKDFFMQLLFSYKINPQTVLFLGYSSGYEGNQQYAITGRDRTLFFKIGYAWQL